ncbi:hypothetical protein EXS73_00980 [Candidatus Pacearchaeota archaeon]|nr:hypothetical protein [Candidatus Pacearchaeota archaeon]
MRIPSFGSLTLASLLTTGCLTYQVPSHPRASVPLAPALRAEEGYVPTRTFTLFASQVHEERKGYTFSSCSVRADTDVLSFDYFVPRTKGKSPALVILPIMGGTAYPLEHHFARYFADKGYVCVVAKRPNVKEEVARLEDVDALLRHSVADIRHVYDWLEQQPEVDTHRFGLFGVSFGAIRGALVIPLDQRIKGAVLGMPGGDIPYILGHTTEKGLIKHREALLAKHTLGLAEGMHIVREHISFDPLTFAPAVDPRTVLLFLAARDRVVPYEKGIQLREAMGNPKTHIYPTGHYSILPFIPVIRRQAYSFFEERFRESERK